jgi:hypothetical protein
MNFGYGRCSSSKAEGKLRAVKLSSHHSIPILITRKVVEQDCIHLLGSPVSLV